MGRGRQVGRLLTLAQLVARPTGVSVAEAAERLECTRRTIYRDLEALQAAGYPLHSDGEDGTARWRLIEQFRRQHRLPFTHEELTALWMAREALEALDGTLFAHGARSLLEKVRETLSDDVRRRLDRTQEVLAVSAPGRRSSGHAAVVDALRRAAEERCSVELSYASLAGRRSRRLVDPYLLWLDPTGAGLYLTGFDHDRSEVRTFLVGRIRDLVRTGHRFYAAAGWDAQRHLAESFAAFRGRAATVRLAFSGRAARLVAERQWHQSQAIVPRPDGRVELTMRVPLSPGLRGWVLSWVPEVEVLAPVELAREVGEALEVGLLEVGRGARRGVRGVTSGDAGVGYGRGRAGAQKQ
ncbi:MAG: WYL domain-containing protein [Candidatus Eisenbacteria bacterium]